MTAKRIFYAHPASAEDVDADVDVIERELGSKLGASVTSGRDEHRRTFAAAGGWDAWCKRVAKGFDIFVVPGQTIGRATAAIVKSALARGADVICWNESHDKPAFKRVVGVEDVDPNDWKAGWRLMLKSKDDSASKPKAKPKADAPKRGKDDKDDADGIAEFLDDCDELISLCDDLLAGEKEAAYDFASSVREKAQGMREWAEKNSHCTEKMVTSIANMTNGVMRWLG